MRFALIFLATLFIVGCEADVNVKSTPTLAPEQEIYRNPIDRLDMIHMVNTPPGFGSGYVIRDRVTSQEIMCISEHTCYPTGRLIDGKGNQIK
jgi:hypothetical protein